MKNPTKLDMTDDVGRDLQAMGPINPEQVSAAAIFDLLADLREARTRRLGLVRNGKRDLALTSLINELDQRVMELPAATLRQQANLIRQQQAALERVTANRDQLGADNETLSTWNAKLEAELHGCRATVKAYEEEAEREKLRALAFGTADLKAFVEREKKATAPAKSQP